jgi:arachidonate 15-lipoxygenase
MLQFPGHFHLIQDIWDTDKDEEIGAFPAPDDASLEPFKEYLDFFVQIPIPPSAYKVYDNDYFAFLRVGGFNPVMLQAFTAEIPKFKIIQEKFVQAPGFEEDDLNEAISEGRLFIVDYEQLNELIPGDRILLFKNHQKYVYAPIGLFGVRKGGIAYSI